MGMDLRIMKQVEEGLCSLTIEEDEKYILEKTDLKHTIMKGYEVTEIIENYFKDCENDDILHSYLWELDYDSELKFVLFFKDNLVNKVFIKKFQDDEIENINTFILGRNNIDFDRYKNKDELFENDDFKLLFFSNETLKKFEKEYTVIENLKEVGYVRKPFRFKDPEPKIEGDTITFSVGNFEGADKEKINKLLKNREYDEFTMNFTCNTKDDNQLLFEVSNEETQEILKDFLPLEKDMIITIDW